MIGFTVSSMLCGASTSLTEIVIFRLLQGVFGAGLVPLSQAVLLDTYPKEKHGSAMTAMLVVGRLIGSSIGISVVVTMLARNTQVNHASLSEFIHPFHERKTGINRYMMGSLTHHVQALRPVSHNRMQEDVKKLDHVSAEIEKN